MVDAEAAFQHTDDLLPPGTVHILHVQEANSSPDNLVLVPKPSAHPDDPLNWSKHRKLLHIFCVYLYTFTTGVGGTSTYSVLSEISSDTGITLTQLNLGTGFIFLLAGWSNLFWQPLALSIGRRPVFLLSLLGCMAISEWTAWIDSFPQWAAARILYGVMVGPVEVLPEISIPDTYFAHERGAYVGIYSLVLNGSNFIAPLIAGFMNDSIGWRWVQHWCAILLGLNFLVSLFLQEESMYDRDTLEADVSGPGSAPVSGSGSNSVTEKEKAVQDPEAPSKDQQANADERTISSEQEATVEVYRLKGFWDKMALYQHSSLNLHQCLTIAWRPVFIFFQFPTVMWAAFQYGFTNAWYSVYNATASSVLSAAPYNFSASMVGVTYLAPLLGALIGGYVAGPLSDKLSMHLAHRAGGLREPEHRLWGLASYAIILPIGLFMWGIGAAHSAPLGVLLVGSVFCGFGIVAGGSYAIAYNVDSGRDIAGESMVSLILCRNTLTFAFSYAITPWINASGMQNTFIAVGIIAFVTGSSFVLMIWKGKELRTKTASRYWRYAATQAVVH